MVRSTAIAPSDAVVGRWFASGLDREFCNVGNHDHRLWIDVHIRQLGRFGVGRLVIDRVVSRSPWIDHTGSIAHRSIRGSSEAHLMEIAGSVVANGCQRLPIPHNHPTRTATNRWLLRPLLAPKPVTLIRRIPKPPACNIFTPNPKAALSHRPTNC